VKQGERFGAETTSLLTSNLPNVSINIPCSSDDASSDEPNGLAPALTDGNAYANPSAGESMARGTINGASNQPFNNRPPSLGVYYIIALQGTYPSRS
jgi:microcystin-dependent protein